MALSERVADLVEHLETLSRVKRKGTPERPAWYVDNRLLARAEPDARWIIRCDFALREVLLRDHPETFGVRPALEAHLKVEAYPETGDQAAVRRALDAAWELQHRR